MTPAERSSALAVLARYGVGECRRAVTVDATEEVLLLAPDTMAALDVDAATRAVMAVLPHRKVWLVRDSEQWNSEPL